MFSFHHLWFLVFRYKHNSVVIGQHSGSHFFKRVRLNQILRRRDYVLLTLCVRFVARTLFSAILLECVTHCVALALKAGFARVQSKCAAGASKHFAASCAVSYVIDYHAKVYYLNARVVRTRWVSCNSWQIFDALIGRCLQGVHCFVFYLHLLEVAERLRSSIQDVFVH